MNALTVLSFAAFAACSSARLLKYPGVYGGYHGLLGAHLGYGGVLPLTPPASFKAVAPALTLNAVAPAPLAYNVAPVAPVQSQYHAQDELGRYSFGYAGGPSARSETRDAFGVVRGSYNYLDSEGKVQTQHYVADALGFRVQGTNLPVAPDAPATPALPGPIPEQVQDTPEVAEAKAAFKMAYDEAAVAAAAAPDSRKKRSVVAVHTPTNYSPFGFPYGFPSALNYAHPAAVGSPLPYAAGFNTFAHGITPYAGLHGITPYAGLHGITPYAGLHGLTYASATAAPAAPRDAELLRIENNPGHAVSYRVD